MVADLGSWASFRASVLSEGQGGKFPLTPDPLHMRDAVAVFYLVGGASSGGSQVWSNPRRGIVFTSSCVVEQRKAMMLSRRNWGNVEKTG